MKFFTDMPMKLNFTTTNKRNFHDMSYEALLVIKINPKSQPDCIHNKCPETTQTGNQRKCVMIKNHCR